MKILEMRTFVGPNVYTYRRAIAMVVDLEDVAELSSTQIPGFISRLLALAPGLKTHECSRGYAGGFLERLYEGTYMAHIIEHLALELQTMAGCDVSFGRARERKQPGQYNIVYEYEVAEVGEEAGRAAVEIIEALSHGREPRNVQEIVGHLRELRSRYGLGPSTAALVEAARQRGIPVMRIGDGSLVQLGWGAAQTRLNATTTSKTSCVSVDIACDKWMTKMFLEEIGVPTPQGRRVWSPEEAVAAAEELGFPVVVKPMYGNHGNGVFLSLETKEAVIEAFKKAQAINEEVLVEKQVLGSDYRLLVVGEEVVAAAHRIPACVVGDGTRTIAELVDAVNQDPNRGTGHELPLTKLTLDAVSLAVLQEKGLSPASVPKAGEVVYLRRTANLSTGGTAEDVTDRVHPEIKAMAVRAARTIGLDIAGIDIVAQDITKPLAESGAMVIEVNASPGLRMHLYPQKGQPRDVAGLIVNYLFPVGSTGRIPLITVTGTNGKTTVTRLIGHILSLTGKVVGMTTTDGIYVGNELVVPGDNTGSWSARVVLKDPRVEAAVLEVARGGILRAGLGYDYSDIAVITNITEDHFGQDGVETIEDLVHVKSLVAECVRRGGYLVLNGNDPHVREIAAKVDAEPIFFTMRGSEANLKERFGDGQTIIVYRDGRIVVYFNGKEFIVASVDSLPMTLGGLARHNIENAMAAVGAAIAAGVPLELIKRGLETFVCDQQMNPGRFNYLVVNGIDVIVDYGHNPAGCAAVLETARHLTKGRLIGVIGAPGDRKDNILVKVGNVAGKFLDYAIVKEDADLRGRMPGEVAQLIRFGALQYLPENAVTVILDEAEAVRRAMQMAAPRDLVVIFYERYERVMGILNELQGTAQGSQTSLYMQPPTQVVVKEGIVATT